MLHNWDFYFNLFSSPNRLTVTVGDVTLMATESTEQVFGVVRQIPHEDYSSSDQEHDIMLIELDVSYIFLLITVTCVILST